MCVCVKQLSPETLVLDDDIGCMCIHFVGPSGPRLMHWKCWGKMGNKWEGIHRHDLADVQRVCNAGHADKIKDDKSRCHLPAAVEEVIWAETSFACDRLPNSPWAKVVGKRTLADASRC